MTRVVTRGLREEKDGIQGFIAYPERAEKGPGLLSAERRHEEAHAVLIDFDFCRRIAVNDSAATFKIFQLANASVVPFDDRARFELLGK